MNEKTAVLHGKRLSRFDPRSCSCKRAEPPIKAADGVQSKNPRAGAAPPSRRSGSRVGLRWDGTARRARPRDHRDLQLHRRGADLDRARRGNERELRPLWRTGRVYPLKHPRPRRPRHGDNSPDGRGDSIQVNVGGRGRPRPPPPARAGSTAAVTAPIALVRGAAVPRTSGSGGRPSTGGYWWPAAAAAEGAVENGQNSDGGGGGGLVRGRTGSPHPSAARLASLAEAGRRAPEAARLRPRLWAPSAQAETPETLRSLFPMEGEAAAGMGAGEGSTSVLGAAVLAMDRPGPASRLGCTRVTAR